MVVATAAVVTIVATAGAAAPAVAAAAGSGAATGAVTTAVASGATAATVAGSAGAGGAIGAMTAGSAATLAGASAGATATAASTGALVGSAAATGVSASSAGAAGLTAGIASGPVGWLVLGSEQEASCTFTFDCWKAVVHENSPEPSKGRFLRDIFLDSRVKEVHTSNAESGLPDIIVENIWQERFRIEYVQLPWNQLAAHAVRL